MINFEFKNPTKIHFGKGLIGKIANEIPAHAKVLMLYGGGSIKKNGIYEQVKTALQSFEVIEFGGIPANPEYNVLLKALEVNFIKFRKVLALNPNMAQLVALTYKYNEKSNQKEKICF